MSEGEARKRLSWATSKRREFQRPVTRCPTTTTANTMNFDKVLDMTGRQAGESSMTGPVLSLDRVTTAVVWMILGWLVKWRGAGERTLFAHGYSSIQVLDVSARSERRRVLLLQRIHGQRENGQQGQ